MINPELLFLFYVTYTLMSANNPRFFGVERDWLTKAKFAKLMDDYVSNPRPSDPKKTSTTNVRNSDKTFITLAMYNDIKRVLEVI